MYCVSGVDYCDVFREFRLTFWWHPFTAEHPLVEQVMEGYISLTHLPLRWLGFMAHLGSHSVWIFKIASCSWAVCLGGTPLTGGFPVFLFNRYGFQTFCAAATAVSFILTGFNVQKRPLSCILFWALVSLRGRLVLWSQINPFPFAHMQHAWQR